MLTMIEYMVRELVDEPENVIIKEVPGDEATTYEVHVSRTDVGKVLGKQGRIANAIRVVVKAVAKKNNQKIFVDITG